ncbi:hypothetical protein AC579_1821 [Pseudocercospora musae]|uniref:MAPEG family protein n=1 Tax=Pseudocercospora musae TaxID=113226 RepID=A0A139IDJ6_9PEZI|nr:hypothetical protein AC579_1821 [Pseudocercospora musae]
MSSPTTLYNYSYAAVPGAFVLGLVPHSYYLTRLMMATKNAQSNAMPRTNLETWKGKLPHALWNHLARARGAHLNSMEVFPLFAAAMVAGNVAKLPVEDLNSVAWSFFTSRALYMALYLGVKSDMLAPARTGAYVWSISIPIMALWRAGKVAAENA